MITRSFLTICLLLGSSMTASQAFDCSTAQGHTVGACGNALTPVRDRCVATMPQTLVYGATSDHGPGYDAQGNPIDPHGNIVAVPDSGQGREVFVSERCP